LKFDITNLSFGSFDCVSSSSKVCQFVCCKLIIANWHSICSVLKSEVETIAELCITSSVLREIERHTRYTMNDVKIFVTMC